MSFEEILDQALAMLQRRGRVSYRALQRQFALDDTYLEDIKAELLYAYPQVSDDQGRGLIWTGDNTAVPELYLQRSQFELLKNPCVIYDGASPYSVAQKG